MASNKSKRSYVSQLRRIQFFPSNLYFRMFIALCHENMEGKARSASRIMEDYFRSLPEKQRTALLTRYESMTTKQRKHPGR